ncbi:hypothetical protein DAEQUDRAFT_165365 [Daedalea quercina L-15889]|uniref:N-acetyltransferase domain-containing protein n=1 Tax=Daedalea quercina L-15889 TaxID=1314783 RepID=A0A165RHM3_9APHY|nr:hypothetical protein DAEQUDRAFT_165365 [Daedalea quercina L-15889]
MPESRRAKRRKRDKKSLQSNAPDGTFALTPLLEALEEALQIPGDHSFDTIFEHALPEFLNIVEDLQGPSNNLKPLSRQDARQLLEDLSREDGDHVQTFLTSLIARKLSTHPSALRRSLLLQRSGAHVPETVTPLPPSQANPTPNPQVLDALYSIQTTPYESSFLSRIQGLQPSRTASAIAVDWETRSPWMELMCDIREHYSLMHPEREQSTETMAPIEYVHLRPEHLPQVHDLLRRTFWEGINVSDALHYSPAKCTVVATYKRLVVGAAFLSSPQETYITYLAVRSGWENAQIATTMLYHLVTLNPNRDVTLHVSINNPAMLLYNRFGFKAEEFIVGFYEDYLDPQSRASKNAFRLRLRR